MHIITIDPSLTSTAMVINDTKFIYCTESNAHTKKGNLKGWFAKCEDLINIRVYPDTPSDSNYAVGEVLKVKQFHRIVNDMMKDIKDTLGDDIVDPIIVAIEGYSFSSAAGPLIDLVSFGTILRTRLLDQLPLDTGTPFNVIAPTRLKLLSAKLTYPAVPKNKSGTVVEWRNAQGVAGGSFKKHDIYKCLTDNSGLVCPWVEYLREVQEDIMNVKTVPKPIEDINDAKIMYEVVKAGLLHD